MFGAHLLIWVCLGFACFVYVVWMMFVCSVVLCFCSVVQFESVLMLFRVLAWN